MRGATRGITFGMMRGVMRAGACVVATAVLTAAVSTIGVVGAAGAVPAAKKPKPGVNITMTGASSGTLKGSFLQCTKVSGVTLDVYVDAKHYPALGKAGFLTIKSPLPGQEGFPALIGTVGGADYLTAGEQAPTAAVTSGKTVTLSGLTAGSTAGTITLNGRATCK